VSADQHGWERVRIASDGAPAAYAGRIGKCLGWEEPSTSGVGPVIGAGLGPNGPVDVAIAVSFDEAAEPLWFAPHLIERVDD
jgi:hypothetical protein